MAESPLFITGYMRSGTTLLGNIVDRHPDISIFVESFFIPRYYYTQAVFWPLSREANRARLAKAVATEPRSVVNGLEIDEFGVARESEPDVSSVIDAVMTRWAAGRGSRRWGDKSPGYLTKLPVLLRMFPDARFVHIYRDGRDVLLSVRGLLDYNGWDGNAARVARDWAESLSQARAFGRRHPDRYMEVQYEQLIGAPARVIERLTEFAGLSFDPSMLETTRPAQLHPALATWDDVNDAINPNNFAKWKKKADPEDVATFEYMAGDRLREFGYDLSDHTLSGGGRLRARTDLISGRVARPFRVLRRGARFVAGAARPKPREDMDLPAASRQSLRDESGPEGG